MSLGICAPTCTSSAHQSAVSRSAPQSPTGHLSILRAALAVGRGHWFPPWAITYHMPEMSIRHACLRVALRERYGSVNSLSPSTEGNRRSRGCLTLHLRETHVERSRVFSHPPTCRQHTAPTCTKQCVSSNLCQTPIIVFADASLYSSSSIPPDLLGPDSATQCAPDCSPFTSTRRNNPSVESVTTHP